ncbi:MAG: pre-16S rRNA-processing nuclease YqgF [Candidatus Cybelea sp.]
MTPAGLVLGVDPGRSKAGFAVVDPGGGVVARGIEAVEDLPARLTQVLAGSTVDVIALGRGTNGRAVRGLLEGLGIPIYWVDEFETSRAARSLYFVDHPPRGWRRLIPTGLQLPDGPVDDYAAIVIARRFLARGVTPQPPN